MNSFAPFHRYLVQEQNISLRIMASPLASRLACSLSRIEFVSYGLLFHLQLLSTPHYCDAVTFGYRPGNYGRTGLSPVSSVRSKAHQLEPPAPHTTCPFGTGKQGCFRPHNRQP
jgi:hypothetical protein